MTRNGERMLILGAILMACVSLFHFACAVIGPAAFRASGSETMASAVESGAAWPTLLAAGLGVVFAILVLYPLSAAGRFRRLPLVRVMIVATGAVFALRGIALVPESLALLRTHDTVLIRNLFYSAVALLIGALYLLGLLSNRERPHRKAAHP